jgi:hypothetical protein
MRANLIAYGAALIVIAAFAEVSFGTASSGYAAASSVAAAPVVSSAPVQATSDGTPWG